MATAKAEKPPTDLSGIVGNDKSDTLSALGAALKVEEKPKAAAGGLLSSVKSGKELMPPRIFLYGLDGFGKSTFAAQAPDPMFLDIEDRLREVNCSKTPHLTTYSAVAAYLKALTTDEHKFGTVVVDTMDWLERLIWDHVCQRSNASHIEKVGGGFGKGYKIALEEWREVLELLSACNRRGMVVILIAHANIERFEDPINGSYDRYEPRLHYLAQDMFREWVDATLFLTSRMTVKKEGTGFNERGLGVAIGADGGERILKTVGSPAWIAKNSYNLPSELPFQRGTAWGVFVDAMMKGREL